MIQIVKREIPLVLQENQQRWTIELINLIQQFGKYENIPEILKSQAFNKYRNPQIQEEVINITSGKCVFCDTYIEAVDYTNIEHFYPKSIYPKYTFKWSNLFPSCRKCNIPKGDTDTKVKRIVNPLHDNPEAYFKYKDLKITVRSCAPDKVKAKNTIEVCNLGRVSLIRARSEILFAFCDVEVGLKESIEQYNLLSQSNAKLKRAASILEAVENLKTQSGRTKPLAGFLRHLIRTSEDIRNALKIINTHQLQLGLNKKYSFGWGLH